MTEFEYRELAGKIFEQHLRHQNSTDYYVLYTVRFALSRRTQWYNFLKKSPLKIIENALYTAFIYCKAYNLIVAVSSYIS